jgi:hypothetical protein
MKRIAVCAVLATACTDDTSSSGSANQTDGETSSSGAHTETGHGSESSTGFDATSSAGGSSSTDNTSTSASTESSSTAADSSTGDLDDGCLPPEIFAAIDQHAHDLAATADLLATHPSQNEVTGFLLAPGLPDPPALPASFAGLFMPCSDPTMFTEYCEMGRCSQIECTGEGSAWIHHLWLEMPLSEDPWAFDEVDVWLHWSGGDGVNFDIETSQMGPGGVDVSLVGAGEMGVDSMSVSETFDSLHDAGDAVLEYAEDPAGYSGQLTIAGVVVAEVDAGGHLVPTGDCP